MDNERKEPTKRQMREQAKTDARRRAEGKPIYRRIDPTLTAEERRREQLHRNVYNAMRFRCYSEKCEQYADYGGRGIRVCERWNESFQNFIADMGWRPSDQHQIGRLDFNSDYSPENCVWTTRKGNMNNKRNPKPILDFQTKLRIYADSHTHTDKELAVKYGVSATTILRARKDINPTRKKPGPRKKR